MREFDEIYAIAAGRKGGAAALEALIGPEVPERLAGLTDDRLLSAMARAIFQAGFNWQVIEAKWPGFEAAFEGFEVPRVAHYHDADFDRLVADRGIVRNPPKIRAVMENAVWLGDLATAHGTAARFFADWPDSDIVGLLDRMTRDGTRLGGNTGQRILRAIGKGTFVLSRDVTARLIAEGVITKPASSKRDMAAVQAAFNVWSGQSGRSLTAISRVLAMSIGTAHGPEGFAETYL